MNTQNDLKVKNGTKFFLLLVAFSIIFVSANRYRGYIQKGEFMITTQITCSPSSTSCFVADCEPTDPGCDTTPYKKISLLAKEADQCVLEHTCTNFSCPTGSSTCTVTFCSNDNLESGEKCLSGESASSTVIKK
jgi:hypothetical protein